MFRKFRARMEIKSEDFPHDGAFVIGPQGQRLIEKFDRFLRFALERGALRKNCQRFDRPWIVADGSLAIIQGVGQPAKNDEQPGLPQ